MTALRDREQSSGQVPCLRLFGRNPTFAVRNVISRLRPQVKHMLTALQLIDGWSGPIFDRRFDSADSIHNLVHSTIGEEQSRVSLE